MKFLVLGITGKRGSGKDTAALHLKEKYGFQILTYTKDVLTGILEERGKPVIRDNLVDLALEMRSERGKDVLTKMISDKIGKEGLWAISGVRYPEEVEYFRNRFGDNFKLVDVACKTKERYERVLKRGTKGEADMTFEKFMEVENRETELMINETVKLADFLAENSGPREILYEKMDKLMIKMGITNLNIITQKR